jgi:hypothetical protein
MLVNTTSLFKAISIILCKVGILLAKINQNGVAFTQFEVAISDERNLAKWINLKIFLGSSLIVNHIHDNRLVWNFADIKQALDSPSWLASHIPI